MKQHQQTFSKQLWLAAVLFAVLAGAFAVYTWSEKQIDRANDLRHQSFLLADELRQSSDDLTRMARTYVITGDARYKAAYQAILDIRDGKRPRPVDYQGIYWDLMLVPGQALHNKPTRAASLLELMKQAGFTPQELAGLTQAKASSDQLTTTEFKAMQLVETGDPQAQARARLMLHDEAYHEAKAAIMRPIKMFSASIDARTQHAVEFATTQALVLRLVFIAFALVWMALLLRANKILRATLGGSVDDVFEHISRIGQGDLKSPIDVNAGDDNSVLGWLEKTRTSLNQIEHERQDVQAKLAESETRYRSLIDWSPEAFVVHRGGKLVYVNPAAVKLFGADSDQDLVGRTVLSLIHPDSHALVLARMKKHAADGMTAPPIEEKFLRLDGTVIHVEVQGTSIEFDGAPAIHASIRDITGRKQAEEAQRIAATAFESQQGMVVSDAQRVFLRVNKAFTDITGYSADEAVGQTPHLLMSERHNAAFYGLMKRSVEQTDGWAGEVWNRRKNGEEYPQWLNISAVRDDADVVTHYVAAFTDLSERKLAQAQIETLAFYDPLTHLPNRRLLMDRLAQALNASIRHTRKNALLMVDLDNFKTLNDTLGHVQGDLLLTQVAQRLKTCVREGDTVARMGSDEFVVMLDDLKVNLLEAATQAEAVGEKILAAFQADFQLASGPFHSTPSIGITLFGGSLQEPNDQPLKRAELAMFQAKAAGRNTLRFFDTQMQADVSAHAALEADLREAVHKQQFLLHYQPQVVGDGRLTGVEALVRWQHPRRGMVPPAEFIPLAEASSLILPIGQWVLETACEQLAAWATQPDLAQLTMAVNVSARQFHQPHFVDAVLATLARTAANPNRLKLELTESMLVDDVEGIIAKMGALKARGVGFSLDDFGTGYSSLSYLKRLPLNQLKIDQGFVRNIVTDPNDAAIAKMVVALAESMGLSVIAEGVELQAQADFLAHLGCHAYQGYLFSRPLPVAVLEAFARSRKAA